MPDDARVDAEEFERARRETVRYHEELYASVSLGDQGTWLANPQPLFADAMALLPTDRSLVAYDLGAGVGRHTIPLLQELPSGSDVYATDLLSSALEALEDAVPPGIHSRLHLREGDLEGFEFEARADLVFAFSVVEHLPSPEAIRRLFARTHDALAPGGVLAVGIIADRTEITDDGTRRPGRVESGITALQAADLLADSFGDHDLSLARLEPSRVRETRGDESYTLDSTLVTWLSTSPR